MILDITKKKNTRPHWTSTVRQVVPPKALGRMGDKKSELETAIDALEKDIKETNDNMDDLLDMRNQAVDEFKQAMKDDANKSTNKQNTPHKACCPFRLHLV